MIELTVFHLVDPNHLVAASKWSWLLDLERACSLLVGRSLNALLLGPPLSNSEKMNTMWLESRLFSNGLERPASDLGEFEFFLFYLNNNLSIVSFFSFIYFLIF